MFEDKFGARADVLALQSLAIGSNVSGSVVDAWVHVLNDDPNLSLSGMPRRLFCVHTIGSRVSAFECGLKTSLSGRHHLVDLNDFDMVFVPVLEVDHYYLVVFDLEEERINLIAHLGDRGSGGLLRDNESYILKTTPFEVKLIPRCAYGCFCLLGKQKEIFVDYLKSVNHPKATAMHSSVIMKEALPWSTTHRNAAPFVDSSIFAMRHMERFVGSRRNFFFGFSVHGARKKV
ncbi:hypothetical protein Hanom_Chr06g00573381 [Helianthus anomalus]